MLRFDHVGGIVDDRLRNQGFDTVGEVQDYGNVSALLRPWSRRSDRRTRRADRLLGS